MGVTIGAEERLKNLVEAGRPENKMRRALKWKRESRTGKIIGTIGPNVPDELISAAGIMPLAVSGSWNPSTPRGSAYRPDMGCLYCTHVLESILNGELDYLNGIITTKFDDDFKCLWDVINYLHKPSINHIMYLPHVNTKITLARWRDSVMELKGVMEEIIDRTIYDDDLSKAATEYNTAIGLLRELYELRKGKHPPLTGAEYLGITTAAKAMPIDEFNRELKALFTHIKSRKANFKQPRLRILVSSDHLDNPGYIEVVENAGCVVAMDDLDTGSRYFWNADGETSGDLWNDLAMRYMNIWSPRMENWEAQVDQLIKWVRDFKIDGVVELRQLYSYPREFMSTYVRERLKKAGIPHLVLRREYHLAGVGQLSTRVEAFLEMLMGKRGR